MQADSSMPCWERYCCLQSSACNTQSSMNASTWKTCNINKCFSFLWILIVYNAVRICPTSECFALFGLRWSLPAWIIRITKKCRHDQCQLKYVRPSFKLTNTCLKRYIRPFPKRLCSWKLISKVYYIKFSNLIIHGKF